MLFLNQKQLKYTLPVLKDFLSVKSYFKIILAALFLARCADVATDRSSDSDIICVVKDKDKLEEIEIKL